MPVLIGTEAVLHRVPPGGPVGLVAYLELDQELLAPRARAAEQALWLVVRGARLLDASSIDGGGRLLLQTRLPDHEVVAGGAPRRSACPSSPPRPPRREALGFPPFGGLAELGGARRGGRRRCAMAVAEAGVTRPRARRGRPPAALLRAPSCERSATRWPSPGSTPPGPRAACGSTSTLAGSDLNVWRSGPWKCATRVSWTTCTRCASSVTPC